jgi:hypothetical protein
MMNNALHDPLRLNADDPGARTLIADTVDALLAEGTLRLRVVLDGDRLASETIAGLVAGLRRLRERGGAIEVTALQDGVRNALAITGLERVFAFPIEQPEPRRSLFARLTAATFAAGLTALSVPSAAAVDRPTDPTAIIARVLELLSRTSARRPPHDVISVLPYFARRHDVLQEAFELRSRVRSGSALGQGIRQDVHRHR